MSAPAWFVGPVSMEYRAAWELQRRLQAARIEGVIPDVVLLVEHPPVVTLGRGADASNVLLSEEALAARGIGRFQVERGGDVTYHGPGQITGYPILDLEPRGRDLHRYLRDLEEVLIRVVADHGFTGERVKGLTGVWVDGAKVAALGIKVRRWVTMHGFALNVNPSLEHFQVIVPCGIADKPVTSLARLLGGRGVPSLDEIGERLFQELGRVFEMQPERRGLNELEAAIGRPENSDTAPA